MFNGNTFPVFDGNPYQYIIFNGNTFHVFGLVVNDAGFPIQGSWVLLGGSEINSAFHPSKVGQMSTRNICGLSD